MFKSFFGAPEQPKKPAVPPPPGPLNPYQRNPQPGAGSSGQPAAGSNRRSSGNIAQQAQPPPQAPSSGGMFAGMDVAPPKPAAPAPAPATGGFGFARKSQPNASSTPAAPSPKHGVSSFSFVSKNSSSVVDGSTPKTPTPHAGLPPSHLANETTSSTVASTANPALTSLAGTSTAMNTATTSADRGGGFAGIIGSGRKKTRSARMPGYARTGMATSSVAGESHIDFDDVGSVSYRENTTEDLEHEPPHPPPANIHLQRQMTPEVPAPPAPKKPSAFGMVNKTRQESAAAAPPPRHTPSVPESVEQERGAQDRNAKEEGEEVLLDSNGVVKSLQKNVLDLLVVQRDSLRKRAKLHSQMTDAVESASRLREDLKTIEEDQNRLCEEEKFEEAERLDIKLDGVKTLLSKQIENSTKLANGGVELDASILASAKKLADAAEGSIGRLAEVRSKQADALNMDSVSPQKETSDIQEESERIEKKREAIATSSEALDNEQQEVEQEMDKGGAAHVEERSGAAARKGALIAFAGFVFEFVIPIPPAPDVDLSHPEFGWYYATPGISKLGSSLREKPESQRLENKSSLSEVSTVDDWVCPVICCPTYVSLTGADRPIN